MNISKSLLPLSRGRVSVIEGLLLLTRFLYVVGRATSGREFGKPIAVLAWYLMSYQGTCTPVIRVVEMGGFCLRQYWPAGSAMEMKFLVMGLRYYRERN